MPWSKIILLTMVLVQLPLCLHGIDGECDRIQNPVDQL